MYIKILATLLGIVISISSFSISPHPPKVLINQGYLNDTLIVQGKVLDSETKNPIKATISYERIPTRDDIGIISSDSSTGEYKLYLQPTSKYKVTIMAANFITAYQLLELDGSLSPGEAKDIFLIPLKVGQVFRMNSITFERGKAKLLSPSHAELDNVYKMLQDNPKMEIQLEGHTDNAGSPKANLKLSEDRVNAVREYLVEKGIKKTRIEIMAFGGSKPLENNSTEQGRIKNRRVEIRILRN